ncbi:hypothetical protein ACK12G_29380 [Mycolicibacterium wolinskyi]|uniref:hypothetical protein n=1 Tax=Mycolicibacterium wolinskyi TaxID=59750 RepID=UPI00391779C1
MSTKVVKCSRCRKRHRGQDGWNEDYIAGLVIGYVCPDCQTSEESIGAQVNLVLSPPSQRRALKLTEEGAFAEFITRLADAYPDPVLMRSKADTLAAARKDEQATEMVRLMRRIADDMESGELWED